MGNGVIDPNATHEARRHREVPAACSLDDLGYTTGTDGANALALSPDGSRLYVTGVSSNGLATCVDVESTAYATVAYDTADGHTVWSDRYYGLSVRNPDEADALAVSADGASVFVSGTSDGGCVNPDSATLAYPA